MTRNYFIAVLLLIGVIFAGAGHGLATEQEGKSNTNVARTTESKSTESRSSEDSHDGNNGEGQSQGTPSTGISSPTPPAATPGTVASAPTAAQPQASISSSPALSGGVGAISLGHNVGAISRMPSLDQQQTRQAILQGQAASMSLLLAYLNQNYPGEVLDVKLHPADAGLVYEVRYLSNIMFLHTVYLDAKTLKNK